MLFTINVIRVARDIGAGRNYRKAGEIALEAILWTSFRVSAMLTYIPWSGMVISRMMQWAMIDLGMLWTKVAVAPWRLAKKACKAAYEWGSGIRE